MTFETKYGPVPAHRLPITLRRAMQHIADHGIDKRSNTGKEMAEALEKVEAIAKVINPHLAPQSGQEDDTDGKSQAKKGKRRRKSEPAQSPESI